jgi:hypothetical protein
MVSTQDWLLALATAAGLAGHRAQAGACQQEMQAIVDHGGDDLHRSLALWSAALLAWLREDLPGATARVGEALRLKGSWGADDRYVPALCLELSSWIAADQRRHRRAATLMGAADARWTDIGAAIGSYPHLSGHRDIRERELRNALGDTAFTEAAQGGRVLPYDDTLAYALDEPPRLPPAVPQEDPPSPLSRREMEVAKLITRGLSNRQIAAVDAVIVNPNPPSRTARPSPTAGREPVRTAAAPWCRSVSSARAASASGPVSDRRTASYRPPTGTDG